MKNYRFSLEKYKGPKSRYFCPKCKTKKFVRYIDLITGEHVSSVVGRCNREIKCGYHLPPREYFDKNNIPAVDPLLASVERLSTVHYFDNYKVVESQNNLDQSHLFCFLIKYYSYNDVLQVFNKYQVGISQKFQNSTVFWHIDANDRVRSGKIMSYDKSTGKRHHKRFSWIQRPKNTVMEQCFFGLHLTKGNRQDKAIHIVESEKTALICELEFPGQFIWLSSGGLRGLQIQKFKELPCEKITLFPDLSSKEADIKAFDLWGENGKKISKSLNLNIKINSFLESICTTKQRDEQWDLADFILETKKSRD